MTDQRQPPGIRVTAQDYEIECDCAPPPTCKPASQVGCTCGSGGHPRKCELHPLAFAAHCASLDVYAQVPDCSATEMREYEATLRRWEDAHAADTQQRVEVAHRAWQPKEATGRVHAELRGRVAWLEEVVAALAGEHDYLALPATPVDGGGDE